MSGSEGTGERRAELERQAAALAAIGAAVPAPPITPREVPDPLVLRGSLDALIGATADQHAARSAKLDQYQRIQAYYHRLLAGVCSDPSDSNENRIHTLAYLAALILDDLTVAHTDDGD